MSTDVEFGAFLPRWDEHATPSGWRRIATAAEEAGFAWIGRGDRVVFPDQSDDPEYASRPASELFSVLSYVANETSEIRVGTNVCVAPYRHPIHLVKQAFTLDSLTDGRFELGVSAGWLEGEFDALGVPYDERGSRTDEFLDVYDAACERGTVSFDGPHHSFDTAGFHPRPVQDGGPPLWLGGSASPTFRRAADRGVGWTISGFSPEEVREGRDRLLAAWDDYGREGEPEIAANVNGYVTDDTAGRDEHADEPLIGSAEAVLDGVETYCEAGATRLNLTLSSGPNGETLTVDERVAQIERFGADVLSVL